MDQEKTSSHSKRYRSYRSGHRARSHESAHAEAQSGTPSDLLDHPLVAKGAPALVSEQSQLIGLIQQLRQAGRFGYDSEFIGELTYVPKLCLIQVASTESVTLIDPLNGLDLRPFWELIADPSIEKIVHAGQQDLEPVVRELGKAPSNVFDTQISAGFIGLPYPLSLSKLVAELTGVKIGKGLTFTHWDQRPLSAIQLRYAADDVRYLVLMRQHIGEQLTALGHTTWAAAECAAQCDPKLFQFDPDQQCHRVRGAGGLPPRNLAILRALVIWRDGAARTENVPPRALLKDEVLLELARNPVRSVEKLDRVRGLPRPVEQQYGYQIVQTSASAAALDESQLPKVRHIEPSPPQKFRIEAAWAVAQCLCAGQSIDPAVVTSRQEVSEFFSSTLEPTGPEPSHRLLSGWRRAALGEPLLQIFRGETRARINWQDGTLKCSLGN